MDDPTTASTSMTAITTTLITPTSTSLPGATKPPDEINHLSSVVSFIIGFAIIMGSSLLNASGLNLTKLDHVRSSALPKASRQKDWKRPLWLLGMTLYILSQLIGSTLALEYMRAEYVAPLGSSSLIFNFLFASFLLGTPVTRNDVYGTLIIVLGVIGIVTFGSINSGLINGMSLARLISLWTRGGWLFFFITMFLSIFLLYLVVRQLDVVYLSRSDMADEPQLSALPANASRVAKTRYHWLKWNLRIREMLNERTASKSDKQVAWILGVGWSCCGGLMAGGCLVFAKACVKLISGSLSHENEGNQFLHPAAIVTIILLALTAVMQIVCLNRGLKVYDSTLVVPVFYGIYTASGFLYSLIFNDEVDAYQSWTLFLVCVFIFILIGGVILLTSKKPPPPPAGMRLGIGSGLPMHARRPVGVSPSRQGGISRTGGGGMRSVISNLTSGTKSSTKKSVSFRDHDDHYDESHLIRDDGSGERRVGDDQMIWDVGADSDDDELAVVTPASSFKDSPLPRDTGAMRSPAAGAAQGSGREGERIGLMDDADDDPEEEEGRGGYTRTLRR